MSKIYSCILKSLIILLFILTGFTESIYASNGKILIILPAANTLTTKEGTKHPTDYFLSELVTPAMILAEKGFEFDVATPNGVSPTVDVSSDKVRWFKNETEYAQANTFLKSLNGIQKPIPLSQVKKSLNQYVGLFIPGGHAAMEDLPKNSDLGDILKFFNSNHRPTALICHGPAALLSARNENGNWIYKGYSLTVFSTEEEKIKEQSGSLGGHVLFYVEDEMRQLGGKLSVASPWQSHVVVDRELVTGQNPMSDRELASAFIELLLKDKSEKK
ncbi:MAG: type 1 glutamine amidotransferase domain-containing protein [Bacteriovoracaceae bacterium]